MSEPVKTGWPRRLEGCRHGGAHPLPAGCYAAPIGTCRCCGFDFVYISEGMYSQRETRVVDQDPTLCQACGGAPRIYHVKDGMTVQSEPGSHGTNPWETPDA